MSKLVFYLTIAWFFSGVSHVQAATNASLYFTNDQYQVEQNVTNTLEIAANPKDNQIVGIDIILKFDPRKLEITNIAKTDAFSDLLGLKIDNVSGQARFSVANERGRLFTQTDSVALVSIKARQEGTTEISFDFSDNKTQDTNMVTSGSEDVLASIGNASINTSINAAPKAIQPVVLGSQFTRLKKAIADIIETPTAPIVPVTGSTLGTATELAIPPTDDTFFGLLAIAGILFTLAGLLILAIMRQRDQPVQNYYTADQGGNRPQKMFVTRQMV